MPAKIRAQRPLPPPSIPLLVEKTKEPNILLEVENASLEKAKIGSNFNNFEYKSSKNKEPLKPEYQTNPVWYRQVLNMNDSIEDPTFTYVRSVFCATTADPTHASSLDDLGATTYYNGINDDGIGAYLYFSGGIPNIDGITIDSSLANRRVLVKNQNNSVQNGIYIVSEDAKYLYRTTDFDNSDLGKIIPGVHVFVQFGTQNTGSEWIQTTFDGFDYSDPLNPPNVVGYNSITFAYCFSSNIVNISAPTNGGPTAFSTYGRIWLRPNNSGVGSTALTLYGYCYTAGQWLPSQAIPTGSAGGDLTGTYPNPTIANDAVTFAKIQNITDDRLLGRSAGSNGDCQEITVGTGLDLNAGSLTSTITQYTDEMSQDATASLIQNGTGITWAYNDVANTLTPTVTVTQYTDELAQDAVGTILTDSSTIDFTYNDSAPSITADVLASPAWTTGTAAVPAVSATQSAATTLAANTVTKITFLGTPNFDIGSYFDHTTNSRYTPLKAGIYQVDYSVYIDNAALTTAYSPRIYKNGSLYKAGQYGTTTVAGDLVMAGSCLVNMNGSTDYIDLRCFNGHLTNTANVPNNSNFTYLDIHYVGPLS